MCIVDDEKIQCCATVYSTVYNSTVCKNVLYSTLQYEIHTMNHLRESTDVNPIMAVLALATFGYGTI